MVSKPLTITTLLACALTFAGCRSDAPDSATAPPTSATPNGSAPEAPVVVANETGKQLYQQYCSGCHGAQGQGVPKAGVALADEAGEEAAELRATIFNGKGKMPGFKGRVNDAQVAAIIEHLRTFAVSAQEGHDDDKPERHRD